jgi:hypothetical protein
MYTWEDILLLGDEFDQSPYGELRKKEQRKSFYDQLSEFLVISKSPDDALIAFLKEAYDRFFIEDNMKVFFGPFEDMPLYVNSDSYALIARWRFKIGH